MPLEKLTTTSGNLELYIERVTPGPPTQAAAKGAICVNLVEPNVYENLDGATTWRRFAGDTGLTAFIVSPTGPYTSINDAILAASAAFGLSGQPQVVLVAPGTYNEALVTLRRGVSVQGFPSEPIGSPTLVGRVATAFGVLPTQVAWFGVNINNASANPAITVTGAAGVAQILALEGFLIASGGKGVQSSGGDLNNQVILKNVASAGSTVGLFVDMITGALIAMDGVWMGTAGALHVGGALATSTIDAVLFGGDVTIDVGTTQAIFDTCDFIGLLVNNAVGATLLKNVAFLGGAAPAVTGAGAVQLVGALGSTGGFPIFTTAPVRFAGDGPEFAYDSSGDPVGTWVLPAPTTYNEAISRLAAVVSVGATVPIP